MNCFSNEDCTIKLGDSFCCGVMTDPISASNCIVESAAGGKLEFNGMEGEVYCMMAIS
jgi:hypothetical protein